jgi:hypothetical protein
MIPGDGQSRYQIELGRVAVLIELPSKPPVITVRNLMLAGCVYGPSTLITFPIRLGGACSRVRLRLRPHLRLWRKQFTPIVAGKQRLQRGHNH